MKREPEVKHEPGIDTPPATPSSSAKETSKPKAPYGFTVRTKSETEVKREPGIKQENEDEQESDCDDFDVLTVTEEDWDEDDFDGDEGDDEDVFDDRDATDYKPAHTTHRLVTVCRDRHRLRFDDQYFW